MKRRTFLKLFAATAASVVVGAEIVTRKQVPVPKKTTRGILYEIQMSDGKTLEHTSRWETSGEEWLNEHFEKLFAYQPKDSKLMIISDRGMRAIRKAAIQHKIELKFGIAS